MLYSWILFCQGKFHVYVFKRGSFTVSMDYEISELFCLILRNSQNNYIANMEKFICTSVEPFYAN